MKNEMKIEMARGDLFVLPFALFIDNVQSDMELDNIYFTVKKRYTDKKALIQKKLSDNTITSDGQGSYVITIDPEDTEDMEFGSYEFDIEVVKLPSIKKTFIGTLELTKEVTHHYNEEE